jgi:hypothetical protein
LSVGDKAHDLQPTIQQQGQPISIVRQQTWSEKWQIWVGS